MEKFKFEEYRMRIPFTIHLFIFVIYRALEAQVMMKAMMKKYEDMKSKLDGAKKNQRSQHQQEEKQKKYTPQP